MAPRRRQILLDGLVTGLPLAILYALTLQGDIGIIDSGELAGVSVHLGIAHPTGYPLYSLLGRVVSMLAPPGGELTSLAGLSALAVVLASVLFVSFLRSLLESRSRGERGRSGPPEEGDRTSRMAEAVVRLGGLAFGTSSVVWSQAVANEVYGLHLLFVVLILWLGLRICGGSVSGRSLPGLAYAVGLAGGHHLSVVFLGPATLLAIATWSRRARGPDRLRVLGTSLGFGLLGLSTMLYLPLRSRCQPLFDWGDPETISSLIRHVGGAQYRVWHFQSSEWFFSNCGDYLQRFPDSVGWIFLALVPWGAYLLVRYRPLVGLYLGLAAAVTFVWASGYEIFDLEPYYLPVDAVAIAFGAYGAVNLLERVRVRSGGPGPRISGILGGLLFVSLIAQVATRYPGVDRSRDHVVRYHLGTLLATVPEKAVLLSAFWDAVVSPLLYLQSVEGKRTDLTVVDPELLRRSWYYPQLERWDPELLDPLAPRIGHFLTLLEPFETGDPFDAAGLERGYRGIIEELAHAHRPERATVFTAELVADFARGAAPVPEGLVFVLRDSPSDSPTLDPPDVEGLLAAGLRPDDRIHAAIVDVWIRMMGNRVRYLERFGRTGEAEKWRAELERLMPYWSRNPASSG